MLFRHRYVAVCFGLFLAALPGGAQAEDSYSVALASYEEKVQPVLFKNCSGCHTSGGHAGGLKLDSFDMMLKGGSRGPAITPGKPESSVLSKAVHYDGDDIKMPP